MSMTTEIIKAIDKKGMEAAAQLIRQGEVVAFPTETVYGLGADVFSEDAVQKIYNVKDRPTDNPLIVHMENINFIENIAIGIPDEFYLLYEKFMPGPLTVILHKNNKICPGVTAGLDTVAVRFPRHRAAVELIKRCGRPIAAPSANRSKHISPTTAEHVLSDLGGRIPMIIDGGECSVGIESTILDMSGDNPVILRPGLISGDMLKKVLKNLQMNYHVPVNEEHPRAPGMKYKHYSPDVDLFLASGSESGIYLYDTYATKGKSCIAIVKEDNAAVYDQRSTLIIPNDSKNYAKKIYALLRQAETMAEVIICEAPLQDGAGTSIMNRLEKAASIPE